MDFELKALIVDDEIAARANLSRMIGQYCEKVRICDSVPTVQAAVMACRQYMPDIIFLDMKLGKQSGFQLLDELETNVPNVIITSAYSEFAIGAIKREVFDYLVKPVKPSELCASIDRLRSKTELKKTAGEELAGKGIPAFQKTRKMLLNSQKSTVLITLAELLWCKSDKNYTECALSNGNRVVISKTLKWFEEQLEPFGFYRVHHQYLINIWHISRLLQDGGLMVEMNNGDLVEVSRRKKAEFIREIGNRLTRPS